MHTTPRENRSDPCSGCSSISTPRRAYGEKDTSPYFWHNGLYPTNDEYKTLYDNGFADYRLHVGGIVEKPVDLSLADLRALPRHEQITQHFFIQGWSGVAKWGVSMKTIVDVVKPHPEAKWVVFYSLGDGPDGGIYDDAHPIEHMSHHLTMLAYDMNDKPLPYGHGAPLRRRNKNELGSSKSNGSAESSSSNTFARSVAASADTTKTTSFSDIGSRSNARHRHAPKPGVLAANRGWFTLRCIPTRRAPGDTAVGQYPCAVAVRVGQVTACRRASHLTADDATLRHCFPACAAVLYPTRKRRRHR